MSDGDAIREQLQRLLDQLQDHRETLSRQREGLEEARSLIEQASPRNKDDLLDRVNASDQSLESARAAFERAHGLADELLRKV